MDRRIYRWDGTDEEYRQAKKEADKVLELPLIPVRREGAVLEVILEERRQD